MKVTITARHLDFTPDLKTFIHNHISKVEKQFAELSHADIILTHEKDLFRAYLKVSGGKQHFHANAMDGDVLRAIDIAVRHIRDQVDKSHKKRNEHFKHRLSHKEVLERLEDV